MSGQIPGVLKAFLAFLTGVRALTCVGPLVSGHIRGSGEGFATLLAHVRIWPVMDREGFWEFRALDPPFLGFGVLCSALQFAVLLGVTVLNVLQEVRLLHVEEWALGASKDLGGHLNSGAYANHKAYQLMSWFLWLLCQAKMSQHESTLISFHKIL